MRVEDKEKIILIGGGDFAKKVTHLIHSIGGYNIVGYTDVHDKGEILSIPYLGTDDRFWSKEKELPSKKAVVCIAGNIALLPIKQKIIEEYKLLGVTFPKLISLKSTVNQESKLGDGVILFDYAYIDFGTKIKDFSVINLKATICHDCHIGKNVLISPHSVITGGVTIGDNCMIGSNSTINPYIEVGSNIVLGSNSLVTKNIFTPGVYTGSPAKIRSK